MTEELTEPKATSRLSGQFDIVAKGIIRQFPDECIQFCLGIPDAKALEILETEQPIVKWFRADSFIRADIQGEEAIIHLEFQTHDSVDVSMSKRIAGYTGLAIRMYQIPIYSHVIYLHPEAGRNDPGKYIQDKSGYEIAINYKVIRLCDIDGQNVLDSRLKGLIPFAPLMKPREGIETKEWLRECVRVADNLVMDESDKPDYLASLSILSGLISDYQTIREIISEEIMNESSVIQHFMKQGIEQGKRKSKLEDLIEVLHIRFQTPEVITLKPMLESIEELQELKRLLREAVQVESLEDFKQILSSNGK